MKKTSSLSTIAVVAGLFLGAFALSAAAGTWTPAPPNPPSGNTPPPIESVGTTAQDLTLGTGGIPSGLLTLGALVFKPGGVAVTPGSVMTADTADGVVKWAPPSGSSMNIYTYSMPFNDPVTGKNLYGLVRGEFTAVKNASYTTGNQDSPNCKSLGDDKIMTGLDLSNDGTTVKIAVYCSTLKSDIIY